MYTPNCDVFWVGSYPLKDPRTACRKILKNKFLLPHWPQLPKRSKKERTIEQTYSALVLRQGFPKGVASGWSAIWKLHKNPRIPYFKTQIAGPITLFGKLQRSGMPTPNKELLEYVSIWLEHAFWQIDAIKARDLKPILVLDEPLLPTYMGPSAALQARRTLKLLRSIVKRLKSRGALVGIHCCNRISPTTLIELGVDLVHFDAYDFPSQVQGSREKLQRFLLDGGTIAWGIIPIAETLSHGMEAKLEKRLGELFQSLECRGLPLRTVLAQSMVAPTCGTGTLTVERSDKILDFATTLSKRFKTRYRL